MSKARVLALLTLLGSPLAPAQAQDAAPPTVDLESKTTEATPSPIPSLPELSQLDEAFKQTTLGKAADEQRIRVELRKLQNIATNDPEVVSARDAAAAAGTDLEKRDRLRAYYNIFYGRAASRATSAEVKAAIEKSKAEHIALLSQPRVRPGSGESPPPKKKKEKHKRGSH